MCFITVFCACGLKALFILISWSSDILYIKYPWMIFPIDFLNLNRPVFIQGIDPVSLHYKDNV